ncbi:MAG: ATP-binding protein [Oscillospiraceae bacterium]|nr:ATP-binding protein [Oscillospiraceae bacterium]
MFFNSRRKNQSAENESGAQDKQIKKNKRSNKDEHSIEFKFRNLNVAFFVAMSIIMIMVSSLISNSIVQTVSRDYARFYSNETVNAFNAYINRELALVTKFARSKNLVEWFADESNKLKRYAAYEGMINYADMLYSTELYFVINESLNEYVIKEGAAFWEFKPFDVISPYVEYDGWYYRSIESENDYTFNIDVDKVSGQRRLWINHKVMRNGELLGVFCSGLLFDSVIEDIFADYVSNNVTGFVINGNGFIQMDSTLAGNPNIEAHDQNLHIRHKIDSPLLLAEINDFLMGISGHFTSSDVPIIVELKRGEHSFASLAPIAGTDWAVVTLFNSDSLFSIAALYPLIFAMLGALVIHTFSITLLSRRLIFAPLQKLIASIDRSQAGQAERIYGYDFDNELGDVSRNVQHMRDRLAMQNRELHIAMKNAEKASEVKSIFLSNMSHEIRTPMNSIMGFAELALDSDVHPDVRDFLVKISDNTKWLLNIVNDILDISKIESGKMHLEYIPFDMHDVVARCQYIMQHTAKQKGLELNTYAEPLVGKRLLGDPVRLYQALANLLSNAVKFTDTGSVGLSATVKSADYNNQAVVHFEVKDTGIGMNAKQIEKIFKPFIQADSSTTRNYGGTGLGLSIVKDIVELMGGNLTVESAPGRGSKFSFEIVFGTIDIISSSKSGNAKNTVAQIENDVFEKPCFKGLVLVCDDNFMNREVVCEHLARVGLENVTAEDGKIAVDMVRERVESNLPPFELIFMDIFMPVMDGNEAAALITELETGTPIVAVTANVMVGEREKYKEHGMHDCLGKPFTSQELWRVLLKYLTPVSSFMTSAGEEEQDTDQLQRRLRLNFVKSNQTKYVEIVEAMGAGDVKLAHRLAHTLKGNAGLIGKPELQSAAAEVEATLKEGIISVRGRKMNRLKAELTSVLEELRPLLILYDEQNSRQNPPLDPRETLELFEKLESLLENINPDIANYVDEVRAIPGTEELARYIEEYHFEGALKVLEKLRAEINSNKEEEKAEV